MDEPLMGTADGEEGYLKTLHFLKTTVFLGTSGNKNTSHSSSNNQAKLKIITAEWTLYKCPLSRNGFQLEILQCG